MRQNSACSSLRHRRNSILATGIIPAAVALLAFPISTSADAIFAPSDAILGGQLVLGLDQFQVGTAGTAAGANNWPVAESPDHVIDGVGQKYLNFAELYTGFLVRPSFNGGNGSVATSLQLWAANDGVPRDPSSYEIWGTNDTLDFGSFSFAMSAFTQISSGSLALPDTRNAGGLSPLNSINSQTVTFTNTQGFKNYLIVFPTVKDDAAANSMQIAEVQLFGVAAFTSLRWTGSVSSVWNIDATVNWDASGTPSTYSETNGVTFNDTVTAGRTDITIEAGGNGVKPAVVIFENNLENYTLSGEAIVSPGALTLNGTGTVTLNNANTYGGGTNVNAGSLIVGPAGSLGTGPLRVNNPNTGPGTAVSVTFNSAQLIGSLSGTIAFPAGGVNSVTLQIDGDLSVDQSVAGTFAGDIVGAGGLIKLGSSILTLTGSSIYAGPTTILAGTLSSSRPGASEQGALPAGTPVIVNAGATLFFGADEGAGYHTGSVASITANGGAIMAASGTRSTLPPVTLNGGTLAASGPGAFFFAALANYVLDGDVTTVASADPSAISAQDIYLRKDPNNTGASAPVTFNVARGTAPVDLKIQSKIHDLGSGLIKEGDGILALGNASTYSGPTVINAGTLAAGNSGALGFGSVTINDGAVLSIESATSLSGFAGFSLNGGATLDPASNVLTLTDNLGNQARTAFSVAPVNFASGFMASFTYTAGGNRAADGVTFTLQNSSPTAIGGGGGQLGYVGIPNSASLQFNIYTGAGQPVGTNVATGGSGSYLPSAPVNLASGNPILVNVVYDALAGTISETLTDTITNDTYSNVFGGISLPLFIGSDSAYVGFTGATGGQFAQQTIRDFTFANLSNQIALPNAIDVAAGASAGLEIQPNAAGATAVAALNGLVTIGANGALNVTGGATATDAPYELTLGGGIKLAGDATINVANNGTGIGNLVAALPIEETALANLTKDGAGTLTVAGASTYQGTTTVNGGTLLVTGSLSGAATTVNGAATLAGNGTVTALSVGTGGTLAPGDGGIGTLNSGPLALLDGATLAIEIGSTTADQANVSGVATLAGSVVLSLTLTADPADFQTFTIVDGTAPLFGYAGGARFSYLGGDLDEGEAFTVATGAFSQEFVISYAADGGNDVTLTAVPEPGSAALLLLGLGISLRRKRRQ